MATTDEILFKLSADVRGITTALNRVERSLDDTVRSVRRGESRIQGSLNNLRTIAMGVRAGFAGLAAVVAGQTVRAFTNLADESTNIESKLKLVTSSQEDLKTALDATFNVAQDTRQSWESTATLYAKLSRATSELGFTQSELVGITDTINKAIIISGSSAGAASGAMIQLGQALLSPKLQAEELNSILDGMPRVFDLIVEGLNRLHPALDVTRGNFKQLVADGEFTGQELAQAFKIMTGSVDQEFDQMDRTVSQALTQIRNSILRLVGVADDGSGATQGLVDALDGVREIIDDPDFQEGMRFLLGVLVDIASLSFEALGNLGLAIKRVVEESKKLVEETGQAIQRVQDTTSLTAIALEQKVITTEKRLRDFEAELERMANSGIDITKRHRDKLAELELSFQQATAASHAFQASLPDNAGYAPPGAAWADRPGQKTPTFQLPPLPSRKPNRPSVGTGTGGSGGGGGGGGKSEAEKAAEKIRDVIAALEFEQAQLQRTNIEQEIYNELKAAGTSLNTEAGQKIADLVTKIEQETTLREYNTRIKELEIEASDKSILQKEIELALLEAGVSAESEHGKAIAEKVKQIQALIDQMAARDAYEQKFLDTMDDARRLVAEYEPWQEKLRKELERLEKLKPHVPIEIYNAAVQDAIERTPEFIEKQRQLTELSGDFSSIFGNALTSLTDKSKSFGDSLKALGMDLLKLAQKYLVLKPLEAFFDKMLGVKGGGGGGGGIFGALGSIASGFLGSLFGGGMPAGPAFKGGAGLSGIYQTGGVNMGGVMRRPTMFSSKTGLGKMGEIPESIMPLARTSTGQLGVRAIGGGGQQSSNQTIILDLRGSTSNSEIERLVHKGISRAAPMLVNASVQTVVDQRARDPKLFGRPGRA